MSNRREIGRFFRMLLKFIPFLIVAYGILLLGWGNNIPLYFRGNLNYRIESKGHAFTRFKEVKTIGKVDILFLGSSHTYRGFDVRLFQEMGYKVFNLGSSSQTPIQTNILLNRYLDKLRPEIVFYEVNLPDFSSDGVEASLDVIANDWVDWEAIKMAFKINHLKTYNTLFYGYIYEMLGFKAKHDEPLEKLGEKYIKGGYVEKKLTYNKRLDARLRGVILNQDQLEVFESIIAKLKKKKIKFYLVQAPVTTSYYNSLTYAKDFDSLMRTYGNYLNFNEIMHLNDTLDFFDAHHLNQIGVEKFNKELIGRFFNQKRN